MSCKLYAHKHFYESINGGEPTCIDDEIPFEIPDSWEWVRGKNIFEPIKNCPPKSNFHYIDIDAIDNNWHRIRDAKFIEAQKAPSRARRVMQQGDVLFSLVRPYLENIALVEQRFSHAIASTGFYVVRSCVLKPEFAYILFLSPYVINGLNSHMRGDNSPSVKSEDIEQFLYPLPPFQEQIRIACYVNKRGEVLNSIKTSHKRFKYILSETPTSLRQQLIQAAIQGQLVPQDANDEPASILIERIAKARAKQGKKVSKPMSRIVRRGSETNPTYHEVFAGGVEKDITDEIPFEIPESWEWVRGETVFEPVKNGPPKSDFHYIDIDAIDNKRHRVKNTKFIAIEKAPSRARRILKQGDVLFSLVRPYLENIALIEPQFAHAIASTGFYVVRSTALNPGYAYTLFLSPYVINGLNSFMKGDNSPSIKCDNIESFLYPLPPEREQERISARFYELLSQLEQ